MIIVYFSMLGGQQVESALTLKIFVIISLLGMLPGFGLGLPAYLFLAWSHNITLSKCLFVGFLIGMLPIPILFFFFNSDQYSLSEYWDESLTPFCLFETISMGAAFITWLVWRYLPGGDRAKGNG